MFFSIKQKYFVKPNNEKSVKFMYDYFYVLEKIHQYSFPLLKRTA